MANFTLTTLLIGPFVSVSATPDAIVATEVYYQGVLRNGSEIPLSGSHDMTFRFFDATTGGNELLVDDHTSAGGGAVTVSDGRFDAVLGCGVVTEGLGPRTYRSLADVFRDYDAVWLEVELDSRTLSPRVRLRPRFRAEYVTSWGAAPPRELAERREHLERSGGRRGRAS